MPKTMSAIFKLLGKLMLGISGLWFLSSLAWFWTIFESYQSFAPLAVVIGFILLGLFIRMRFPKLFWNSYRWLMSHKVFLVLLALIVQLALLLSADMMIRSDAAVVFNGAIDQIPETSISSYLSRNPNNLMLFLYERFFYHTFGTATVWVLQGLNILYTHLAGWIFYQTAKRYYNQAVADRIFSFYFLLILLTPKFMAMYTDMIVLPILAGQFYLLLGLLTEKKKQIKVWQPILLGVLTGLGLAFRPTVIIIVIAFFTVYALRGQWKRTLAYLGLFVFGLGLMYGGLSYYKSHQEEVTIMTDEGLAKNMLTFVNLGLTYSGTDQEDMKEGLLQYIPKADREEYNNGLFKNENQIAEIERRIANYNLVTFLGHIFYKQYKTTAQGNLNWIYASAEQEKSSYMNPLAGYTKDKRIAQALRDYLIYTDQEVFQYYDYFIQSIWVFLSLGIFLFFLKNRSLSQSHFLALSLFGGLLFLQIFEGGKSRYLIQFLPQILFLSAIGWQNWPSFLQKFRVPVKHHS